jgi:hypothetical protein
MGYPSSIQPASLLDLAVPDLAIAHFPGHIAGTGYAGTGPSWASVSAREPALSRSDFPPDVLASPAKSVKTRLASSFRREKQLRGRAMIMLSTV